MGSPPSPDTALKEPLFTPSHHLKDRLLSFTDFLLSNIDEWSNPHPICPSPPPPFAFSGSDRFMKGRLPHRTVAISASLSSLFSDAAPLPDACKRGDGRVSSIDHVVRSDNGVGATPCIIDADRSTTLATAHSETPKLSSNLNLQVDSSAQVSCPKRLQDRHPDTDIVSTAVCLEDPRECARSKVADALQFSPSHGTLGAFDSNAEMMMAAIGQSNGVPEVVSAEGLVNPQSNAIVPMEVTHKDSQDVFTEAPVNLEPDYDLEEGELSERVSDDEKLTSIHAENVGGEGNIQKGCPEASRLDADMSRVSPSDTRSTEKRVLDSETDEEMNEPISSFVSRRHMQLMPKLVSSLNSNSESLEKRVKQKMRTDKEHHVSEKSPRASLASNCNQVKTLHERLSRVATAGDEADGRLLGLQNGSVQVLAQGNKDSANLMMDGAVGTPNEWLVQGANAGVGQPESYVGLSSLIINEGMCLPTLEAGIDEKLASQEVVKKKTKRGPMTEQRRKKRQRAKHKANERKLEKSGICKLKFQPFVDKTETRPKKTCSYYVQGKCSKGASCLFSHDVLPLTKSEVCRYFVMNSCLKGDDCPYSHALSSFPCKYFHTRGRCTGGESCRFSHEPMSKEAKQELLRKIEEEERVRQDVADGMGRYGLKVTMSSDKSNSSMSKAQAKDKEAIMDFVRPNPTIVAAKNTAAASSNVPLNAANKSVKKSSFSSGSHKKTQPPPDEGHLKSSSQATGMERAGQLRAEATSSFGVSATTQERRKNAEAFLQAQLDESRIVRGRHAVILENVEPVSSILSKQPGPFPIRVSSMSASSKPDAKPLDFRYSDFQNCLQERVSKRKLVENGSSVSESSLTLLDLILRPQDKPILKEPTHTLKSQLTDTHMACKRSASNVFLDSFLK